MPTPGPLLHTGIIERKLDSLPRFVVIPSSKVAGWNLTATATVETILNGITIPRRSLKPWDADRWFISITGKDCSAAAVDTGSKVKLELRLASAALPQELSDLIASSPSARAAWDSLTNAQQRMLREEIASAEQSATRRRRAEKMLTSQRHIS